MSLPHSEGKNEGDFGAVTRAAAAVREIRSIGPTSNFRKVQNFMTMISFIFVRISNARDLMISLNILPNTPRFSRPDAHHTFQRPTRSRKPLFRRRAT